MLVFVFYLVNPSPVHWNATNVEAMEQGAQAVDLKALQVLHAANNAGLRTGTLDWVAAERAGDEAAQAQAKKELEGAMAQDKALRAGATALLKAHAPAREANDKDYIFITWE